MIYGLDFFFFPPIDIPYHIQVIRNQESPLERLWRQRFNLRRHQAVVIQLGMSGRGAFAWWPPTVGWIIVPLGNSIEIICKPEGNLVSRIHWEPL